MLSEKYSINIRPIANLHTAKNSPTIIHDIYYAATRILIVNSIQKGEKKITGVICIIHSLIQSAALSHVCCVTVINGTLACSTQNEHNVHKCRIYRSPFNLWALKSEQQSHCNETTMTISNPKTWISSNNFFISY